MKGKKFDRTPSGYVKPMYHLLPPRELEQVVKVLTFGANKYGENDWQHFVQKDRNERRYVSACLRHVMAFTMGERLDHETHLPHLAHAISCLLFVLWKTNGRR